MTGQLVRFIRRKRPPDAGYRAYLAARERLGWPSRPDVIASPCPWCGADPYRPCTSRAVRKQLRQPHEARQVTP